jgi:hypothetical protein
MIIMEYARLCYTSQGDTHYTAHRDFRVDSTFARQRDVERAWRRAEAQIADCKFVNLTTGRQGFARYVIELWIPNHVMERSSAVPPLI